MNPSGNTSPIDPNPVHWRTNNVMTSLMYQVEAYEAQLGRPAHRDDVRILISRGTYRWLLTDRYLSDTGLFTWKANGPTMLLGMVVMQSYDIADDDVMLVLGPDNQIRQRLPIRADR